MIGNKTNRYIAYSLWDFFCASDNPTRGRALSAREFMEFWDSLTPKQIAEYAGQLEMLRNSGFWD